MRSRFCSPACCGWKAGPGARPCRRCPGREGQRLRLACRVVSVMGHIGCACSTQHHIKIKTPSAHLRQRRRLVPACARQFVAQPAAELRPALLALRQGWSARCYCGHITGISFSACNTRFGPCHKCIPTQPGLGIYQCLLPQTCRWHGSAVHSSAASSGSRACLCSCAHQLQ